jgi:hypothetical protein
MMDNRVKSILMGEHDSEKGNFACEVMLNDESVVHVKWNSGIRELSRISGNVFTRAYSNFKYVYFKSEVANLEPSEELTHFIDAVEQMAKEDVQ